jgi:glycosyltransferase involved in cell wall biosynthesis
MASSSLPEASKTISIVAPYFDEADGIERFRQSIVSAIDSLPTFRFEVDCVDDGSSDDGLPNLIALTEHDQRFRVEELSRNLGKEAALTAGIDVASGDAVIPIDSDLQDPPSLIALLVAEWQKGAEVVLARRNDRSSDSFMKRTTACLFYRIHNLVSRVRIPADVGDSRLMDRVAVEALKQLPKRQRVIKGLFSWVGFKIVAINYTRDERPAGSTKFSGWRLRNFALDGITGFSTAPPKIRAYVGLIGALLTLSYAAFIVLRTLVRGIDIPGYASLLLAVLFLGSLQLISVSLRGEYIGRIHLETKRRPVYIIRRRYGKPDES